MKLSRTSQVVAAFATIYLVWGSTYLAIRVGVSALPPALFAGARFLLAGVLMLAFAFSQGAQLPRSARDWANIAVTGLLMLVGGNGLVTWSEQWIESNQAALIVATSALWLAGIGAMGPDGERVNPKTIGGLLLGFAGVGVLVSSGLQLKAGPPLAYAGLIAASILWSVGSVYSRRHPVGTAPVMTAALQTLISGAVLFPLGLALGESSRWVWEPRSLTALAYLILIGSCVAYVAYFWLVHEVSPARLGTYAYVNPAVAVFLGWWFLGERLNDTQIVGTIVILLGVVIVTLAAGKPVASRERG